MARRRLSSRLVPRRILWSYVNYLQAFHRGQSPQIVLTNPVIRPTADITNNMRSCPEAAPVLLRRQPSKVSPPPKLSQTSAAFSPPPPFPPHTAPRRGQACTCRALRPRHLSLRASRSLCEGGPYDKTETRSLRQIARQALRPMRLSHSPGEPLRSLCQRATISRSLHGLL